MYGNSGIFIEPVTFELEVKIEHDEQSMVEDAEISVHAIAGMYEPKMMKMEA